MIWSFRVFQFQFISRNPDNQNDEVADDNVNNPISAAFITAKVGTFKPNTYGLYDMSGYVAEMISEPGIAVGGSWDCPGYDVRIWSRLPYEGPSPFVGFRPVATFIGK